MDTAIQDFVQFVENMPNSVVKMENDSEHGVFHTINLRKLIENIEDYETFPKWWKSKNLTKHLNNVLIKTILKTNPPESVKHSLIFMML